MRAHPIAATALVSVLSLLVASCSGSDTTAGTTVVAPADTHPVAVANGAALPSGSALGPGVQVQEGSSLIGSVFPVVDLEQPPQADAPPIGWEALLVVDGDPIDVWNRYTSELKINEVASARKACVVRRPRTPQEGSNEGERWLTEGPIDGEQLLDCRAAVGDTEMQMVVGATGCGQAGSTCTPEAEAHLHIVVYDDADDRPHREQVGGQQLGGVMEVIPDGPVQPPQLDLTDLATELPGSGEALDGGLDPYLSTDDGPVPIAVLPEGVTSLVSPALLLDCAGGLVTVLDFPQTPPGAIDLIDRIDQSEIPLDVHQGIDADGRAWAATEFPTAGGYYLYLTAVAAEGGGSTVLVTECGD